MTGLPIIFRHTVLSTFQKVFLFIFIYSVIAFSAFSHARDKPQLQLAKVYHQDVNIRQYWVSEKLDGVRGHWDGKQFLSRQGHVFSAPDWFTAGFPNIALDGELWIARGQFDKVSGIVRQNRTDKSAWRQVRFMLFDLPHSNRSFDQTLQMMEQIVADAQSEYLHLVEQRRVDNNVELNQWLDTVVAGGGEGLMLRLAHAKYLPQRSANLLKLKKYQDAEAVVLAHLPGKGKHKGRMGALKVRDENGVEFKIGTGFSDNQRENPPPIGSVITFKYFGKTANNVPRFASYMRVRYKSG
jgi:DNA ligase-1